MNKLSYTCSAGCRSVASVSATLYGLRKWPQCIERGATLLVLVVALSACQTTPRTPTAAGFGSPVVASSSADATPPVRPLALEAPGADPACVDPQDLTVHYINVGQGASTLVQGPTGIRLLYDFGDVGDGPAIINYLKELGIGAGNAIDYAVLSHRHQDHYYGYRDLVKAKIDVRIANYDSEASTPKSSERPFTRWWGPAGSTTAGSPVAITPGQSIDLGCGASAFVAAANGTLFDGKKVPLAQVDRNDRSVFLLIRYGDFQMTLDGDLGAGKEACTGHTTDQVAVQPAVMRALIREGIVSADDGVDVLHVSHHGSESSTSAAYFNLARPTVAVISVGVDGQNLDYGHPRASVIDTVLLGPNRPSCVTAPPVLAVFQTEDGLDDASDPTQAKTSNAGMSSGNIVISTDGTSAFQVWGDNFVTEGTFAEFPEDEGFVFDLSGAGGPSPLALDTPAFSPFFDTVDNPRNVDVPAGTHHDMTPPAPAPTPFDQALLGLCGDFGDPVNDARQRLRDTLLDAQHADVIGRIRGDLEDGGVFLGEPVEFAESLSVLWTQEAGFQHVFCGERTGTGIGGLHFGVRYLDLQTRGQAGMGATGAFEVLAGEIYTLPVEAACGRYTCKARKKGYGLLLDGEALLVQGTLAWAAAGQMPGKVACRHTYASPLTGQPQAAVFVMRDQGIRTFYPVIRADPSMHACGSGPVSAAPASMDAMPIDTEECGD